MTEIWKDIEGHQGYQVSNLGRVRSVDRMVKSAIHKKGERLMRGRIRKQFLLNSGYLAVPTHPQIVVHRAVAMAFVPGRFEGAQVNHKDENRLNNRWDNLEWVTQQENLNYGTRNQKLKEILESQRGVKVNQYNLNGQFVTSYPSQSAAARALDVNLKTIQTALNTHHTVKGYLFKTPPR